MQKFTMKYLISFLFLIGVIVCGCNRTQKEVTKSESETTSEPTVIKAKPIAKKAEFEDRQEYVVEEDRR
jgi:hypothetical protein